MNAIGPLISIIVAAVMLFAVVVIVGVVVFALMVVRRKTTGSTAGWASQLADAINAGTVSPQERAVLAGGWMGEAAILDRNDIKTTAKNRTMVYHLLDLVLEVRLEGRPSYRAPCRQEFISSESYGLTQGAVVPVRVDPANPQIVYVDREARKQRALQAEAAQREAHARRQAELLGRR